MTASVNVGDVRIDPDPTPKATRLYAKDLPAKGKSQIDFSTWLLFMPATTYAPTHFRVQYHRPSGA